MLTSIVSSLAFPTTPTIKKQEFSYRRYNKQVPDRLLLLLLRQCLAVDSADTAVCADRLFVCLLSVHMIMTDNDTKQELGYR